MLWDELKKETQLLTKYKYMYIFVQTDLAGKGSCELVEKPLPAKMSNTHQLACLYGPGIHLHMASVDSLSIAGSNTQKYVSIVLIYVLDCVILTYIY